MEKLQKISDPLLVDCPACEQPSLKRLVSAAAFRLKGNGWYETDFKKDNKRNLAETGEGAAPDKKSTTSDSDKAGKPSCDSCPAKPATDSAGKPATAPTPNT
jgi:putative FmdB family regulatory protein